jgi:hypothetical protein
LKDTRGEEEKNLKEWYVHKGRKKGYVKDFKTVTKRLLNEGYIARVGGKAKRKYYISDKPRTYFALRVHGYKVDSGSRRA